MDDNRSNHGSEEREEKKPVASEHVNLKVSSVGKSVAFPQEARYRVKSHAHIVIGRRCSMSFWSSFDIEATYQD